MNRETPEIVKNPKNEIKKVNNNFEILSTQIFVYKIYTPQHNEIQNFTLYISSLFIANSSLMDSSSTGWIITRLLTARYVTLVTSSVLF